MGRDRPITPWSLETVKEQGRPCPDAGPEPEQALGLYSCDVAEAEPGFFTWLPEVLLGPPHPPSPVPPRPAYPTCRTA